MSRATNWPPEPTDRFAAWLARRIATTSSFRVVGAIVALIVVFNFMALQLVRSDKPGERAVVSGRYNDALVDGDLDAAWGLGCREDRARVAYEAFAMLYADAVAPLGGLSGWHQLRGGPEWRGPSGSQHRLPVLTEGSGHWCVRLGENPLGEPF
jgi:hypothetical protein